MEWAKILKIVDNLKTKIYLYFKKENFQSALILLYTLLKNSKYFSSGFDQVGRNHKEELLLIVRQRA